LELQKKLRRVAAGCALLAIAAVSNSCTKRSDFVSGTIEVDEVHVAPRMGGRVEKIFVREGDRLKAGDVIVQLEAAELPAQRDLAQAQVDAATSDAEGQAAQLEFLRSDAKRQQELLRNRTVSSTEAERAISAANAQEKAVQAARMRVAQARANLAQIETQLTEMRVVAPGDTVVEILSVKVGDVLPPNREVATLLIPNYLWARVYVPQPWLGHIQLGNEVRVRVDSFRDEEFKGVVEQINRQAEFTPRNVQTAEDRIRQVFGVKIRLENRDDKLRAGMSADVTFPDVPKK
jgi:HlyD family secretion protein